MAGMDHDEAGSHSLPQDPVAEHEHSSSRIPTLLLEVVRSVGIGRGTEVALDVLFLRWVSLTSSAGNAMWEQLRMSLGTSDGGVATFADLLGRVIPGDHQPPEYGSGVLPEFMGDVVSIVSEIGQHHVDAVGLLRESFETVLAGTHRLGKEAGTRETPAAIANLLSKLVVRDGDAVVDPACGVGNALLHAAATAGSLTGIDVDSVSARQVWMRLQIAGHPASVHNNDALYELESLAGRFGAVLLHPPWGPVVHKRDLQSIWKLLPQSDALPVSTKGADDFIWALLSIALLDDHGRSAVILPADTMFPRHSAWHDYLLEQGCVEAIISLPSGGLFADTSIATAVWLLRRRRSTLARLRDVLLIDAASLVPTSRNLGRSLASNALNEISDIVTRWRTGDGLSAPSHVARTIGRHEFDLSMGMLPRQYLAPVPEEEVVHPRPPRRMIESLRLENLKSFGTTVEVELAPLTLIYGANSAGKSSLIQSLLLLKQSVDHATMITQGDSVDLGSFQGIVHKHQNTAVRLGLNYGTLGSWIPKDGTPDPSYMRSIDFEFERSASGLGELTHESISFGSYFVGLSPLSAGETQAFKAEVDAVEAVFQGLAIGTLLYPFDSRKDLDGDEADAERRLKSRQNNARRGIKRLRTAGANGLIVSRNGLLPSDEVELPQVAISSIDDREASVIRSYANRFGKLLAGVANELRCLLDSVVYLGPLRSAPQRFYDRTAVSSRGGDGRQTAMFLFDNSAVVADVNEWFATLELPYTLDVVPIGAAGTTNLVGDLVALQLTDLRTNVNVTPADVGFGVSQVLPVVVELLSRRESVVCVEQPETHLHPRLQSRLADLFIHSANEAGRSNQLIIETHSEHVMLRIQRRIREGAISPDAVSVLYVDQSATGRTELKRLRLDEDGDFLDEWPQGFFDERLEEIFGVD